MALTLEAIIHPLVFGLEIAAGFIILVAAIQALWRFARSIPERADEAERRLGIRHDFGRSLLLAIDFTVGADLLQVATAPSMETVLVAGAVIFVRILLTLILEFELWRDEKTHAEERKRESEAHPP